MRTRLLALLGAAALIAPATAHAQNPLRSIFDCNNPNNRQQGGAIIGGLLGGLLGNQINDNDRTTGTVVGGLLGAAAGSAIGCQMSGSDSTRAMDATRQALDSGRSATWRNSSTGVTGRIDIVNTYRQTDASARTYDPYYEDRYGYRPPVSLADVRWAPGVARPIDYQMADSRYEANRRTNVRAAPTTSARVLYQLRPGEEFDALAMVNGGWILAGRNGEAIGYVSEDVVLRRGYSETYAYNTPRADRYASDQLCRVFDQTITRPGYSSTTERFTACQTARGEWVIQS